MEISGQYRLSAAREEAWAILLAPAALQRALPGCQQLVATGDDRYDVTLKVGVAAIKGMVTGEVELRDFARPGRYTMTVSGKGSIGIVSGKGVVQLEVDGDGTLVQVTGEAEVHGLVASVGQRMLRGMAMRMLDQFFRSINQQLLEQPRAVQGSCGLAREEAQ